MKNQNGKTGTFPGRRFPRIAAAAFIAFSVLAAAPVPAPAQQDSGNLARQLERLRRDLADLQRYVYKGGAQPAPAGAETGGTPETAGMMQVQITQMQDQMRSLNGQIEEVQHRIALLEQRLDRMSEDLEMRLLAIEQAMKGGAMPAPGAMPGGETGADPVAVAPPSAVIELPEGTAREQYNFAYDLLKKHQWDAGRQAMQLFLDKHPKDELADNAAYWIGETYYINKQYKEAAKAFLDGYKKYPKADKAPDNLLKLAKSLEGMGQPENACTTYAKLLEDYPNSLPRIVKLAQSERKRLNCK